MDTISCKVCEGEGFVDVGDVGGFAGTTPCPCVGGDVFYLPEAKQEAWYSLAWGKARAARQVAFQKLERALQDENYAQSRHAYAPAAELPSLDRFDSYRWRVTTALMDYGVAANAEADAYSEWAGRPTVADDRAAFERDMHDLARESATAAAWNVREQGEIFPPWGNGCPSGAIGEPRRRQQL